MKNNFWGKIQRTFTAFLPVSSARRGECQNCGACCRKNPVKCFLLRYDSRGKSYCAIWKYRLLQCRKYPRTENEQVLGAGKANCGYYFVKEECKAGRLAQYGSINKLTPVFIRNLVKTDSEIINKLINFLNNKLPR